MPSFATFAASLLTLTLWSEKHFKGVRDGFSFVLLCVGQDRAIYTLLARISPSLLCCLFQEGCILVDVCNREAQTEAAQFAHVTQSEGRQRPAPLFLASENFDEGKLGADQQLFLDARAATIRHGLLAPITGFSGWREDFRHERRRAHDCSRFPVSRIAPHGHSGADPILLGQLQIPLRMRDNTATTNA